jgi:hypothetical protein
MLALAIFMADSHPDCLSAPAIAALREGKKLLEAILTGRSRPEITIKADGLSVQIKGSSNIDEPIRPAGFSLNQRHERRTAKHLTVRASTCEQLFQVLH